eukprot:scaffold117889_cov30-Phaeocystis_antarctica.AAC.1
MPYALEVIVAVSAWLMRSTVRCLGGGSIVVRAVLHLASLVRWLDARCAPQGSNQGRADFARPQPTRHDAPGRSATHTFEPCLGQGRHDTSCAPRPPSHPNPYPNPTLTLTLILNPTLALTLPWASRHPLRSKAAVSHGEAEWLAYAHAPVDERTTLLWLPGSSSSSSGSWG